ncbi:MAG TPA: histidine phosphatase family protein [Acidobacteriota bacterium]|jgi:probable phosphoglycerate mutase|nr:histidine phosphatase family protein [Acidobacteriota bacterium]
MSTRVLLVRHGATVLTAEDRFAGSSDVLLSEAGEQQAARLAERLSRLNITAVYSSPMKRTMRTAEILAAPHNLKVDPVEGIREIDHGRWEQRTRAEVEREFKEEYEAWEEDPFTFAPVGGESGLSVLARALPEVRSIVQKHSGQAVLVVSHKATIRLLIGSFLGFDLRGYRDRLDQHLCCLNVLDFKDAARARLMLFNDISHYEDHPETPKAALSKWWDMAK